MKRSSNDLLNRLPKIDFEPLVARNFEFVGIKAQLVQDRSVQVGNVMAVFDSVEPQLVGSPMRDATLDSPAGAICPRLSNPLPTF